MGERERPLVSVCMITYNHAKYIKQSIEAILIQEVKFDYEVIIANDCSPDNTDEIVKEIIKNHPKSNRIKYIQHSKNIGPIPNFHFAFSQAKGIYIAICEGDDFWINSSKLQRQVDFLEANKDFAASFHDVFMQFDNRKVSFAQYRKNNISDIVTFHDVVSNDWLIPTCSFVFRKEKMILPTFYEEFDYGDFPLFCCILINSKAHYLNEIMGIYRRDNNQSLTNTIRTFGHLKISSDYIKLLNWLNKYARKEEKKSIELRINKEIDNINKQINIYKNSRFIKVYSALRRWIIWK